MLGKVTEFIEYLMDGACFSSGGRIVIPSQPHGGTPTTQPPYIPPPYGIFDS